jgi:hypothetical protein
MTNEWIDLVDDPGYPRTPLHGGYVLRTGRKGLMALLEEWQAAGVNHAALGIQFSQRPPAEVLEELARGCCRTFPRTKDRRRRPPSGEKHRTGSGMTKPEQPWTREPQCRVQ